MTSCWRAPLLFFLYSPIPFFLFLFNFTPLFLPLSPLRIANETHYEQKRGSLKRYLVNIMLCG